MAEESTLFQKIAQFTQQSFRSVSAVISLHNEGATIPFIARYRREKIGEIDEVAIDAIITSYSREVALQDRCRIIIEALKEDGNADEAILKSLRSAATMRELEDIYLPFKRRRKTAAGVARDAGLEPLATRIIAERLNENEARRVASAFVTTDLTLDAALDGAITILAEDMAYSVTVRKGVRLALKRGLITAKVKRGVTSPDVLYSDYFDFSEPLRRILPHRVLAILRGEKEGVLSVRLEVADEEKMLVNEERLHFNFHSIFTESATMKAWKNYLKPSLVKELLKESESEAHTISALVFFKNFESLLLAPFLGQKAVVAIDPGIRSGCKAVFLNADGRVSGEKVLYLHQDEKHAEKLIEWLENGDVTAIAVGRGTFGRETIAILKRILPKELVVPIVPVSEDGASVYSASKIARDELPGMDISFRGAVSIGRRLQDPLSELVKIDPASLGVGQYQHDIPQKVLKESLERCVHWVVNRVGVNLNSASEYLLAQVSGLDRKKAKNILDFRQENGPFKFRKSVKRVKGVGDLSYKMAAGFLLVKESPELLDRTGVHPENYPDLYKAASLLRAEMSDILDSPHLLESDSLSALSFSDKNSLQTELLRRGRDVRAVLQLQIEDFTVSSLEELHEGMSIMGIIDNVTAFGAFVDIGLKQKGLIHISELSDTFVKDIHAVVSVGQHIRVTVLSVDLTRQRVALSLKRSSNGEQK